jgi:hypothetical protein
MAKILVRSVIILAATTGSWVRIDTPLIMSGKIGLLHIKKGG